MGADRSDRRGDFQDVDGLGLQRGRDPDRRRSLAMVLALSPAATCSPTALRKTSDEIGKVLRTDVAGNA